MSPDIAHCPMGGTITLVENHHTHWPLAVPKACSLSGSTEDALREKTFCGQVSLGKTYSPLPSLLSLEIRGTY